MYKKKNMLSARHQAYKEMGVSCALVSYDTHKLYKPT